MQDFRQMPAVPLKLKKAAAAAAGSLLKEQVAVQEHGLDFGQEGVIAVQVAPAHLDHADLVVGEIVDAFLEDVRTGHEVRIENEDELA